MKNYITIIFCIGFTFASGISHASDILTYDLKRNITSKQNSNGTTSYQYDNLNRLTKESGPQATQTFTYDANGNRLSDGNGIYTYTPNSNQMSTKQGNNIIYDAAGNMIDNGSGMTFEYNNAGRLKHVYDNSVLVASYTYNSFGQRTRKVTPTETIVYHYDLNGQLLEETRGDGSPLRTYGWRENKLTSIIYEDGTPSNNTGADKVVYIENDHLNTPRSAYDENGNKVWSWESDAFGSTAPNEDVDGDGNITVVNLRFPGQYFDAESGLHQNWFRDYDPSTGHYIENDPIGLLGGANTFIYSNQNPISLFDSDGLFSREFVDDRLQSIAGSIARSFAPPVGLPGRLASRFLIDRLDQARDDAAKIAPMLLGMPGGMGCPASTMILPNGGCSFIATPTFEPEELSNENNYCEVPPEAFIEPDPSLYDDPIFRPAGSF